MMRHVLPLIVWLLASATASAQNLLITNARIVTGTGQVIERGSLVVRDGRIASVAAGTAAAPQGAQTIDARGMTLMPGFIDGHRHAAQGNSAQLPQNTQQRMNDFLEAGYTTLLGGGGNADANLALAKALESGQLKGPRFIPAGGLNLNQTPEQARAEVRRLVGLGIRFIGEVNVNSFTPQPAQLATLKAAVEEAAQAGAWMQVHAVSPAAMHAAIDVGVRKLVHTPHFGWLSDADAKRVADAGIHNLSCIAFGTPVIGVFNDSNVPTFRDGKPWPDAIIDGEGRGREAGYKAVNARTLFDNGVVYGFGTDTGYLPLRGLEQELKTLNLMFSMEDVIKILGPHSAAFVEMSRDIGTLEVGKLADIVVLDGNPLEGYWNLLKTKMVVKGGTIVLDKR